MLNSLIPQPKRVTAKNGVFDISGEWKLLFTKNAENIALMLQKEWKGNITPQLIEGKEGYEIRICREAPAELDQVSIGHREGYLLDIDKAAIQISALTYNGLFYGYSSLSQIMEDCSEIPCVTISDHPDLNIRGVHFDLKGALPDVNYIKKFIRMLGRYKINTILMEYEDKFPFQRYPQISVDTAFKPDELREILDTAKECGMEVIPLLQCLGHAEYILMHDEFLHLAEEGTRRMFCPRNEGVVQLFKELAEEILEFHPDSKYFHIGADEAEMLGQCPECKAFMEESGKKKLFLDHINKICSYVMEKGKKPMMWDDMCYKEKMMDSLDELPEGTTLNLWEYDLNEETSPYVKWGERIYTSKEWLKKDPERVAEHGYWIEDLPQEELEIIKKYKFTEEYPLNGHAVPWIKAYAGHGLDVVGASAIKGCGWRTYNSLFCDFSVRFRNTSVWAKVAKKDGIEGVISTAWSKFNSPMPPTNFWESAVYNYLASAENYWNADTDKGEFDRKFSKNYLGAETPVLKAMEYLEKSAANGSIDFTYYSRTMVRTAKELLQKTGEAAVRNKFYIDLLLNACRFQEMMISIQYQLWTLQPLAYFSDENAARKEHFDNFANGLAENRKLLLKWEEDSIEFYQKVMPETEARDYVKTKTYGLIKTIECFVPCEDGSKS